MASLTGKLVAETYKALLKTIDNDILTASEKQITDGFGGGSNVFIDSQGFLRANKYKVTNGLATQFLKADGSLDSNTYLTGITSSQIIAALGYTPVTSARTLTINGTTYDLSANRSWTVAGTAAVWGNISGTLSDQTDLQTALNAKFNNPSGTVSQYIRGDGSLATLPSAAVWGNITGTLSAQTDLQAALDAKFDDPTGNSTQYIDGSGNLQTFPTMLSSDNLIKLVRNQSGATMAAGTIVYINGATGNKPTIAKALATSDATSAQTYGMVQANIANNADGYIVVIGNVNNLDTHSLTEGAQLYLSSTTAGAWTTTKQYAPAHLVYIGIVLRSHPNQGIVGVKIQNGYEMDELHDVSAQTPTNNDGLFFESSTSLWKNKSITDALGFVPQRLDKMVSNLLASATEYPNSNAVIAALALKANAENPVFTGNMTISGAEPKLYFTDTDQNPDYFIGADAGFFRIYDQTAGATRFVINSSGVTTIAGDLIVGTIAKSGGTASQFLKADGSIDTNTYVSSASLANYLLISTAASTYQRLDKMVSNLLASSTEYPNSNAVIAALALKADAANPVFTGNMTISGTAPKLYFTDTDNNPDYTLFVDSGYFYIYDQTAGATKFQITPSGNAINTGTLTSASFIKSGGTSSQVLMADGSVSALPNLSGYALLNGSTANQFNVFELSYASTAFNSSAGARTTIDPMSVKMYQNYFSGTGLGSDYGTVMQYYSLSGHVESQVYFDAGGGSWYRTASYNAGYGSWQRYLTDANYGSYALPLLGGTMTGGITINGVQNSIIAQNDGNSSLWRGRIISKNATSNVASFLGTYENIAGVFAHSNGLDAWADLYINTVNGSSGGTVRMPSSVLINGYQAIHAGNIGSQSVAYAGYSGYSLQLNGYANQTEYTILTGPANGPVWKVRYDSATTNRYFDLGFKDGNNVFYTGLKIYNGDSPTWAGNPLLHSGNYGSYALPLSGGTMTGGIVINTPSNAVGSALQLYSTAYHQYLQIYSNGDIEAMVNYRNSSSQWYAGLRTSSQLVGTTGFHFYNTSAGQTVGGFDINGVLYSTGGLTTNGTIYTTGIVESGSNSASNVGVGIYHSSSYYGRIRFYNNGTNNSTIHAFGTSWVGGLSQGYINIDGQNGVNIGSWNDPDFAVAKGGTTTVYRSLNVNAGGTHSGTTYFVGNGNTGSVAGIGLNVYSNNGSGAVMAFHRGGYYAVNMGLDSDNVFRIGGWSASANRLQLDMSGNLTLAASVNAPSGYVSTPNPWGTNNSAFFPNGITTAGTTNWIYGSVTYIGNAPSNGAGHQFNSSGSATSTGGYTAAAFYESSDMRLKTLIDGSAQIEGIENLQAKLYEKNGKIELGYFAQDAEKLMPYAVTKNLDGFLNLSYREVHTAKIARLEKRVAELEKQLNLN